MEHKIDPDLYGIRTDNRHGVMHNTVTVFTDEESANEWVNSENSPLCERVIVSEENAKKLAGSAAVHRAQVWKTK